MKNIIAILKTFDKKTFFSIAISALFLGAGLAFFLTQKPATHNEIQTNSNSKPIERKPSPTPQKEVSIRVDNDKQLMIELIAQNTKAINDSQSIVKGGKNTSLKDYAQGIIVTLQKENQTLSAWLSDKYGIRYSVNPIPVASTTLPTDKNNIDIDKEYKSQMIKYYSTTSEMIAQVQNKNIPEDIKKYLPEALEIRKKQFTVLDNLKIDEASPSAKLSPTGIKTRSSQ